MLHLQISFRSGISRKAKNLWNSAYCIEHEEIILVLFHKLFVTHFAYDINVFFLLLFFVYFATKSIVYKRQKAKQHLI